jgi:hypothetical protein
MALHEQFEEARNGVGDCRTRFPGQFVLITTVQAGKLVIDLSSNLTLSFSPQDAQGLEQATPSQLEEVEISPSGFGIHFPRARRGSICARIARRLSRVEEVDGLAAGPTRRPIAQPRQESLLASKRQAGR